MKPVVITWNDTQEHGEKWVGVADVDEWSEKDCKIISIGFLVKETKRYLTIVGDFDSDDADYGRVQKIPVGCVVEIKELN